MSWFKDMEEIALPGGTKILLEDDLDNERQEFAKQKGKPVRFDPRTGKIFWEDVEETQEIQVELTSNGETNDNSDVSS